jgi:RNA polymerase sigma-70 factor (ECF subfamily)
VEDVADNGEHHRLVHKIASRAPDARDAEATLCRAFAPRAHLYGRKHLRDEDRARDLAQAVMLAVLEAVRAGRIEDPARLDRFVLGTCRNVALRMRATDARARPTDDAELDTLGASYLHDVESIDTGALVRCLSALDPRGRTVVYLSFNEDRSAEDIATVVETTAGNVRVLRHRAIAQLRKCLDDCKESGP